MEIQATIAIKEGLQVRGITVQNSGNLSECGMMLMKYFKDREKVEKLINLGNLSCLGCELETPHGLVGESSDSRTYMLLQEVFCASKHPKNRFCISLGRDLGSPNESFTTTDINSWLNGCGAGYNYIFNTADNRWSVYSSEGTVALGLEAVLSDVNMLYLFYNLILHNKDEQALIYEFECIQKMDGFMKSSLFDIYNGYLNLVGLDFLEFGYAKDESGHKVYGVFEKTASGQNRRKCICKDKYINLLYRTTMYKYNRKL